MEVKDSLKASLEALEDFVLKAKSEAAARQVDVEGKDAAFLSQAKAAVENRDASELKTLLDEMRGLSHYFCSYAKDTRTLDRLIDAFFNEVQTAIIMSRSGK